LIWINCLALVRDDGIRQADQRRPQAPYYLYMNRAELTYLVK
jgi:hypothetical protein